MNSVAHTTDHREYDLQWSTYAHNWVVFHTLLVWILRLCSTNVSRKNFDPEFSTKTGFRIGHLILLLLMLTFGSIKSPHIICKAFGPHFGEIFEHNRMVFELWGQNFELFWQKWLTIFDKRLTPFWMTFSWLKQMFDVNLLIKHYHLSVFQILRYSIRVTKLKLEPNMAVPISLNEKRR